MFLECRITFVLSVESNTIATFEWFIDQNELDISKPSQGT